MLAVPACYMTLSAAALWVAALSHERDRRHAIQIAAVLFISCVCYNATLLSKAWWMWAPMDAVTCWFVAVRFRLSPKWWKYLIMLALFEQILCHWRWQLGDNFDGSKYAYHLTLNILFLVQLLAVASSGSDRVRQSIRDFMAIRRDYRGRRGVALLHRTSHTERQQG
jgi:hypothetical protein